MADVSTVSSMSLDNGKHEVMVFCMRHVHVRSLIIRQLFLINLCLMCISLCVQVSVDASRGNYISFELELHGL